MTAETALLRLIARGQYDRFRREAGNFLASVDPSDPVRVEQALGWLRDALAEVRIRRAHADRELTELRTAAAYFVSRQPKPAIDLLG